MAKVNKNEDPLRTLDQLADEVSWEEYADRERYVHAYTLNPNIVEERLEIVKVHDEAMEQQEGLVYVLVVGGKVFKIGQSIRSFRNRLGSYNTGKVKYRSRGTNSGANFFVLQSLLHFSHEVEVYIFAPQTKWWHFLGESGEEIFPSAKTVEKIFLQRFVEEHGRLPIGCGQR